MLATKIQRKLAAGAKIYIIKDLKIFPKINYIAYIYVCMP